MEFVLVQPPHEGSGFTFSAGGYEAERAVEALVKKPFYVQVTPVTQEQWKRVMENNPSEFDDEPNCPVERVSWEDCQLFITRLNMRQEATYRLLKEVEWEWACRAKAKTPYFFGSDSEKLVKYAWYLDNAGSSTRSVAGKKPNNFGVYDMLGNVREWTANRNEAVPTPNARVVRGGSWKTPQEESHSNQRWGEHAGQRSHDLGFRLMIELD